MVAKDSLSATVSIVPTFVLKYQIPISRAAKGNACTTPNGLGGVCAYISDPPCAPILNAINRVGVTRQVVTYLQKAIQSPCGFDVTDYTMCCEG